MTGNKCPAWLKILLITLGSLILAGGIIVGVLFIVKTRTDPVNVYDVSALAVNYEAGQSQTEGQVKADRIQSVYLSESQIVTEVYVSEGDTVSAGDPLLAFDTTLTDIQLERQGIRVQQLELQLLQAQQQLVTIGTYRVGQPQTVPAGDQKVLEPSDSYTNHYSRAGTGTAEDPMIFIWNNDCVFSKSFVDVNIGLGYELEDVLDEEQQPTGEQTYPVKYVIFETREGNSMDGSVTESYMVVFARQSDGSFTWQNMADPEYDRADPETPAVEPDNSVYVTAAELLELKKNAQEKIDTLEMDIKKAQLEYETLEYELTNGIVLSKIDGVIKTLNDPDMVAGSSTEPLLVVSGGGGYYVQGAMSETEIGRLNVGDTVSVMSWENYSQFEATVTEISTFPVTNGSVYHYSEGNQNVTLYPFTVSLGDDVSVREGEYLTISYYPDSAQSSGIFLENMFIRNENGQSFVYVAGTDGKLEKRNVVTGRSLWGYYTEILSGLTMDDHIAFPYGTTVEEGAKTQEASLDSLYTY